MAETCLAAELGGQLGHAQVVQMGSAHCVNLVARDAPPLIR